MFKLLNLRCPSALSVEPFQQEVGNEENAGNKAAMSWGLESSYF
jgi:hypothetical protein